MESNSSVPGKTTLADTAAPQCEGSDRGNYAMIPFEDRRLVRKHGGLGLQDYWLDCWEADPYGSRYVLMPDPDLKSSTRRKYRKQLKELGLFLFEIRQNGNNYQLWVLNRHGSRVKSYWQGNKPSHRRGDEIGEGDAEGDDQLVERGVQIGEGDDQLVERGDRIGEANPTTLTQNGVQSRSGSFHDLKSSRSSSRSPRAESGEEEFKIQEKREEATQDDAIRPEGTSKPETVVESEGIYTPESQASLEDKPEPIDTPKDSDRDECSAAPRENENQSQATEDAGMLKWLVEVKLPSMELNEAPRNPEAYAKAMIRRDGDALREEFAEVVRDRQFKEECAAVTEKVQTRADEWRQAGIQLAVFYDFDGRPQVLLDGATIAAGDFLNMPTGVKQPVQSISAFSNPENVQNRKIRQSRLRTAVAIGEHPGLEFLVECWGDVILQPQIKQAIKKHPHWGIFVNDQNQLEQFGSVSPIHCPPQVDQPSDSEVEFPQPQEIQMSVELHPSDNEYQHLMQISQTENGAS